MRSRILEHSHIKEAGLMWSTLKRMQPLGLALGVAFLATAGVGAADSWVSVTPQGNLTIEEIARAEAPRLDVIAYDDSGIVLTVDVAGVALLPRATKGGEFVLVTWPDAAVAGAIGAPALPVIRRLFIARPDDHTDRRRNHRRPAAGDATASADSQD
jgi:hypothetical protein